MGIWNYRIFRTKKGLEIREAYYVKDGRIGDGEHRASARRPDSWSEKSATLRGDTLEELRWQAHAFLKAFDYPILEMALKKKPAEKRKREK